MRKIPWQILYNEIYLWKKVEDQPEWNQMAIEESWEVYIIENSDKLGS